MPIRLAAPVAVASVLALATAGTALAETIERTGTFGGLDLTYRVALPEDYDPAASYPTILHFAGGGCVRLDGASWRMVVEDLGEPWPTGCKPCHPDEPA